MNDKVFKDLELYIKNHSSNKTKTSSFVDYLYSLMNKYGFDDDPSFYNKANVSKQLWSSIKSGKSNPSLNVCLKFAFTLHVNNEECKYLLKKAGFTLASSSKFALIIRYAIENKIYEIYDVNDLLIKYGYENSIIE